jgi:hypothetical protein
MTKEETASLLEEVAERLANGDRSFDLQSQLARASETLAEMRHVEGLILLNRLKRLLPTEPSWYGIVRETVEALPPLDPASDADALRSLASDVRSKP